MTPSIVSEIRKDVPVPTHVKTGRKYKYQFDNMQVGDMFEVTADEGSRGKLRNTLTSGSRQSRKRNPGWEFLISITSTGVGVWRTA